MIQNLSIDLLLLFIFTTIATLFLFYWAVKHSTNVFTRKSAMGVFAGLTVWSVVQGVLALKGVYSSDPTSMPPKLLLLGVLPALAAIVYLFNTQKGKLFIDSLPLANITYLNMVRIPVEITLLQLFMSGAVPRSMTFEGHNFDIISGITAPIIAFGLVKGWFSKKVVLVWNCICLALLANVVVTALLSAPSPIQQFAFDQPNIAILYLPFSWLPTIVVPIVLFGHLVSIRQLTRPAVENQNIL